MIVLRSGSSRSGSSSTSPGGDGLEVACEPAPGTWTWPSLAYGDWSDTCDTLHAHTQVPGKLAVVLTGALAGVQRTSGPATIDRQRPIASG